MRWHYEGFWESSKRQKLGLATVKKVSNGFGGEGIEANPTSYGM